MITANQSYRILKDISKKSIGDIREREDCYYSSSLRGYNMPTVHKNTGTVEYLNMGDLVNYLMFDDGVEIYVKELFDDFLEACRTYNNESELAELYSLAWNNLYSCEYFKDSYRDEDYDSIYKSWKEIEAILNPKMQKIIEEDKTLVMSQSVKDNYDDLYYRYKPITLRNGFTTDASSRIWIQNDDYSSKKEK